MKTFLYAVQWVDHGGDYHEPQWESQVPTALTQMGFGPKNMLVDIGGVRLANKRYGLSSYQSPTLLFGCIETTVPLSEWDGTNKNSERWVESIRLWFRTFEVKQEDIIEQYDFDTFEPLYYGEEE